MPVSGSQPYLTSLFRFGPTEGASRLVSGGSFGPEGSLMVTLVWGLAASLAYRYFRTGQPSALKARPQRTPAR